MMRNLLSLLVVAGLVYGAYEINQRFFAAPAETKAAAAAASDPSLTPFVCHTDVEAFDPAAPDKTLGYFTKGTEIKLGADSGTPGMKNVVYQQPDGRVIQALCKVADLKQAEETPAVAPLEKKKQTIMANPNGTGTWLGNNQMTIQQGCSAGGADVVKMGQTKAKTIGSTFGNEPTAAPAQTSAPTAAQGVKERAKDLQNPNPQPPPSQ